MLAFLGSLSLLGPLSLSGCAFLTAKELDGRKDFDDDGFVGQQYGGDDCDETNAEVHPGADEICGDGLDNDCDGTTDIDGIDASTWYVDDDHDGYGGTPVVACEKPDGGFTGDEDCDDGNSAINPDQDEICNDLDDNCDGLVDDEGLADGQGFDWYPDADGDGYGNAEGSMVMACDQPAGYAEGYETGDFDCDDTDAAYNPGATEACTDAEDYNCDGAVDFTDLDADGAAACVDCDDDDPSVNPSAVEYCNGFDDNCDGTIDEDAAVDAQLWYADTDTDGFGDETAPTAACTQPVGRVADRAEGFDCDDTNPTVYPDATELCDGVDHDCDTLVDEEDSADALTWYTDADADSYGVDDGATQVACSAPAGTASLPGDCNDTDAAYNPAATETNCADPNDYNCDGSTGYANADGDAFAACEECDDTSATNYPGAPELCDGVDNNCDSEVDESTATDAQIWFADSDTDGFGDPDTSQPSCSQPSGFVSDDTDCDDTNVAIWPAATEYCDGLDHDCDTLTMEDDSFDATPWYTDADLDGFGTGTSADACVQPSGTSADGTDCDDSAAAVNPGASEDCNTIDDDCDTRIDDDDLFDPSTGTTFYADGDLDGYGDPATTEIRCADTADWVVDATDCDDTDVTLHLDSDEDGVCDVMLADDYTSTTTGMEMVAIPAGTFTMGGGKGDPEGAAPDHAVTLTHDFWIGRTEVTRAEWEADPENSAWAYYKTDCPTSDCPADALSWEDAAKFANWLSAAEGLAPCYTTDGTDTADANPYDCAGYRLPTEGEWEYAARAGVDTEFSGGDTASEVAWTSESSSSELHVGCTTATPANAFALCDLSGNLFEWVNDWSSGLDTTPATDPVGATSGPGRVIRGGSWSYASSYARVAHSSWGTPDIRYTSFGFGLRLARTIPLTTDTDADGFPAIADGGTDCNDSNAAIYAGAPETCGDSVDDDCDGGDTHCLPTGTSDAETSAEATFVGEGYASAATIAGDINGDGYDDVVVGDSGNGDCGSAYVLYGPQTGTVSLAGVLDRFDDPACPSTVDGLGSDVSGAGDVDGDGFDDVLLASYTYGDAWLQYGPVTGAITAPDASWSGDTADRVGHSVTALGDMDGDGIDDFAVGSSVTLPDPGVVYVILGSPARFSGALDARVYADTEILGLTAGGDFGWSIASAGDATGDGHPDLIVGEDGRGSSSGAYVFAGPLDTGSIDTGAAAAQLVSEAAGEATGFRVSGAGDVDADGVDDVLVSDPFYGASDEGRVYLQRGPLTGAISLGSASAILSASATAIAYLGSGLAGPGDVDQDGFADILCGAQYASSSTGEAYAGVGYLFAGPVSSASTESATTQLQGAEAGDALGSVGGGGDVDADGFPDMLVGGPGAEGGVGAFYLIPGGSR